MKNPNMTEVRRLLPTLDDAEFAVLIRAIVKVENPTDVKTPEWLQMAVYEWLLAMAGLKDAEARLVLKRFAPTVKMAAAAAEPGFAGLPPKATLAVSDRQYAASSHERVTFYDFRYDEEVETLPQRAVTHTVCDLLALHGRLIGWLRKLRTTDGPGHHAGGEAGTKPLDEQGGAGRPVPDHG